MSSYPSVLAGVSGFIALALAGCSPTASAPPPQAAVAAVDPAALGVSGGPLGSKLDPADRSAAGAAQMTAVETGERKSWRGKQGAFGLVEPGPEATRSEGVCRDYSHTIYIDGRPQSGKGLACRTQGVWRIVS